MREKHGHIALDETPDTEGVVVGVKTASGKAGLDTVIDRLDDDASRRLADRAAAGLRRSPAEPV